MNEQIAREQAPHVPDAVRLRRRHRAGGGGARAALRWRLGRRRSSRSSSRSALAWGSYFNSDKIAHRRQPGQAGRRDRVPPLPQPRRGSLHRRRAPEAEALRGRRSRAQRVRDRSQPEARRRSRSRPACSTSMNRVELEGVLAHELSPRQELRHPRHDDRGHRGRHDRADLRHRPALRVLGRHERPARQQRRLRADRGDHRHRSRSRS